MDDGRCKPDAGIRQAHGGSRSGGERRRGRAGHTRGARAAGFDADMLLELVRLLEEPAC